MVDLLLAFKHHEKLLFYCAEVLKRFNLLTRAANTIEINCDRVVTLADLTSLSTHSFDPTLSQEQKATYHYLRGKLFNLFTDYVAVSEDDLCKAVKLHPTAVHMWRELGECFWKKGDIEEADNCFSWVLEIERTPQALTESAMVKRRLKKDKHHLEWSIRLCKEALQLDLAYTDAWVGLGLSYMAVYFHLSRNTRDLKMALAAFNKTDPSSTNPDLFQSRASIHQYFENYDQAIADFERASALDPALDCRSLIESIQAFVRDLSCAIETKGNLTEEEIDSAMQRFTPLQPPLQNEVYIKDEAPFTQSSRLRIQILSAVPRYHDAVGSSYLVMDSHGDVCALTILNIHASAIKPRDLLVITAPAVVTFGPAHHLVIRVDDPIQISLNGARITPQQMAWTEMRCQ
ncbi:hypothetical protein HDU91_007196 [Kappamyces sp. JEL0680]|nr:hypothetical protein HDU91_007196 [Kappamyces sp. JEL0680]